MLDSRVVLSKFQESSSYIQECRDKALNLLLGLTGSGKTTIINAILGYDLDKNSDGTVDRVDSPSKRPFQKAVKSGITETETSGEMIEVDKYNTPITKKNLPKIGHGAKSETSHPTLYHEAKKNCFLLDCAGFGDTRSNEDRVSISLAMESAFRNASNINSVFIVINYNDLISERGKSIKKLAKMMMSLFSDIEKAAKSLHFVFTHLDSVYNEIKIDNLRKCERDDIPANQIANEISIQEAVYNRLLLIINNIISALEQQTQSWSPAKLASFGRYGLGVVGSSLLNKMGYNSGEGINLSLGKESFFKDARKNARLLYFFKLIQKSLENKVALLFNVTDQQHINLFRDRLLDVINTTRGLGSAIPIQAFNFKEYDSQRTKFEHEIKDSAWKFYHLLNDINELPQEIANLEGQIGHLNLLINNYNKNLQESPDNSVNRLGQIQLVLDEQKKLITDKQDEIDLQMAKLAECKKEKDNLESDDLVSDSYHFEESRWSFLILPYFMSYSYKVFDVNERSGPISHYEITPTNGRCEVLGYVKEKGILSISYISATGEDGKCSLVVYYKKRFYSDNPQKIQSYRSEINRININIDRLNGELGKYQSKYDALSNTHQGNRLTIQVAQDEIKDAIQLYKTNRAACEQRKKSLEQRLAALKIDLDRSSQLVLMMRSLMLECVALRDQNFLEALKKYESTHELARAPEPIDSNVIPKHFRSQLSDTVMNTPIRLNSCGHIMDIDEFQSVGTASKTAHCPCCIKLNLTAVNTEKNDLSMFEILHDLANEIVAFSQPKTSMDISEKTDNPDQDIEHDLEILRAQISKKQAKLIILERQLASLMKLPLSQRTETQPFEDEQSCDEMESNEQTPENKHRRNHPLHFDEDDDPKGKSEAVPDHSEDEQSEGSQFKI